MKRFAFRDARGLRASIAAGRAAPAVRIPSPDPAVKRVAQPLPPKGGEKS